MTATNSLFEDPFVGADGWTVVELTNRIAGTIDAVFPDDVWVIGEMSGLNRSRGGHVYFDLVEPMAVPGAAPEARVPVVLFSQARALVNQALKRAGGVKMTDGMRVRIRAAIEFYPRQGRLQLRMTGIDPAYTIGALAAEREALLRRLRADGTIDLNRSIPLSPVPLRIGLVTSAGSAAAADFLHELELSGYSFHVVLCDTRVQGQGAEHSIAAAIGTVARRAIDAIAVVRGGGSRGDLIAFDAEVVALAIARAPVPVLTGIGHEIDRSVADDVAHTAAKTPTACSAQLVDQVARFHSALDRRRHALVSVSVRSVDAVEAQLMGRAVEVRRATTAGLVDADARLRVHASALVGRSRHGLSRAEGRLDHAARSATGSARRALAQADRELDHLDARRVILDPARMFARGWSVTRDSRGRVVLDPATLAIDEQITSRVLRGTVTSRVEPSSTHDAPSTAPPTETRDLHERST